MTHITQIELGDYQLGFLSAERTRIVREHLDCCPYCQLEGLMLEDYLNSLNTLSPVQRVPSAPRMGIFEQMKVLIAGLVKRPSMALAGGFDDEGPYIYEVGDIQISIQLQEDFEMPDRKMLMGLITGTDTSQIKAHLWEADQPHEVAVVPVDEFGNFFISDLVPANYELILDAPHTEIHIQALNG